MNCISSTPSTNSPSAISGIELLSLMSEWWDISQAWSAQVRTDRRQTFRNQYRPHNYCSICSAQVSVLTHYTTGMYISCSLHSIPFQFPCHFHVLWLLSAHCRTVKSLILFTICAISARIYVLTDARQARLMTALWSRLNFYFTKYQLLN